MKLRGLVTALVVGGLAAAAPLATPAAHADSPVLGSGGTLACGNALSANGYSLNMQCDGNLVERDSGGNPVWTSRTNGPNDAYRLVMQGDGNLVIYRGPSTAIFATGTNVSAGNGADLELQGDGNAVVYAAGHVARWASKSRAEAAITWYYTRLGSNSYDVPSHRCEAAAENSFGTSGQYATAIADWNARTHRTPGTAAPRGTLVFYNTTSGLGHVAVSLGNGQVISSTSDYSPNAIGVSPISWPGTVLGWDYSPWGTPW